VYKEMAAYLQKDVYPFHMPGHKRNPIFFPPNLQSLDLTEIPGMDVLGNSTGIIKALQQDIAKFCGADYSFLLVNGSSVGLIAAVSAVCTDNETLVVPRNAHTSVYNAMVISGATPQYIMPEVTDDGLPGGIKPEVFDDMPQGAAVLVVSPTYEGFVSDISAIAAKVHEKGGVLIVDEAHGAHFKFADAFPMSAIDCGADIVIQSLHKTLPAPSQCAVLHVKSNRVDVDKLRFMINAMQTTSPSYIFMATCDYMLHKLWQEPEHFKKYIERLKNIHTLAPGVLRLVGRERVRQNAIFDMDISKLLFENHSDISGEDIAKMMSAEYKVEMEMATDQHVLAMTSVADTDEGFERLGAAIQGINSRLSPLAKRTTPQNFILPEVVFSPRKAMQMPHEAVSWQDAVGRISAQLIAKYPPGIALVAPGERISQKLSPINETIKVIKER